MNVFDLQAKLSLDDSEYRKGLDNAEGKASSFSSKAISSIGGGLKTAAKVGAVAVGAVTTAIGAATGAIGALTYESVEGYGEYEQLVGGVQKLYGNMGLSLKDYAKSVGKSTGETRSEWKKLDEAQNIVLENASNAYATAGMSANKYMETATSFSAALISSLGGDTVKAAEMTDKAMTAMSDNWNTFGGDFENIQNAFQGFAKQNYTMLDNLKLGYGGTKTEMERLIADANEYAKSIGQAGDLSINSFSDIVEAIDLVQQKQQIAGTTSREATTTISGSFNMMKNAWENLVTGFANPDADIGELINNVMTSVIGTTDEAGNHINGFIDNILPAIEQAVSSIGTAITEGLPTIIETAQNLLTSAAPSLRDAAISLTEQVIDAIPGVLKFLVDLVPDAFDMLVEAIETYGPEIVDTFSGLIKSATEGIAEGLPDFIDFAMNALVDLSASLRKKAGDLVDVGLDFIMKIADGLIDGIPTFIETVPTIVSNIAGIINDNAPKLFNAGITLIGKLAAGLIKAIPTLVANLPKIIKAIWDVFIAFNWVSLGAKIITFIGNGIKSLAANLPNILKSIGQNAIKFFQGINWAGVGSKAISLIIKGITALINAIPTVLKGIGKAAILAFKEINWIELGKNIIDGIVNGIKAIGGKVKDAITGVAGKALNAVKSFLGIHSPSKVFQKVIGENISLGVAAGIEAKKGEAVKKAEELASASLQYAQTQLDNYKVYHKLSLEEEAEYWDDVRKSLKKGTQARIEADKKYFEIVEKLQEEEEEKEKERQSKRLANYVAHVSNLVSNAKKAVKDLATIAKKAGQDVMTVAQLLLDNYKVYHDTSLKYEMEYWDAVRKQYKKGTQERIEADKKYFEARDAWKEAIENAKKEAQEITEEYAKEYSEIEKARDAKILKEQQNMIESIEAVNKRLAKNLKDVDEDLANKISDRTKKLEEDIKSLTDTYTKSVESRANSIMGLTGLFDRTSFDRTYSKEYLMDALSEQVSALEDWDHELDALEAKLGRDNPLLKALEEMGVSSLYTLQEVNSMSEDELKAYSDMYAKKSKVANERAKQENQQLLDETNRQIETLRQQAAADIQTYQAEAEATRAVLIAQAETDRQVIRDEAEKNIQELLTESQQQLDSLTKKYTEELDKLAETVKEEGDDVGQAMCEGIAAGIEKSQAIISAAAQAAAQAALAAAQAALGIASPSKEFAKIGKFIDEGFAKGISDNVKLVSNAMDEIINIPAKVDVAQIKIGTNKNNNASDGFTQNLTINAPQALSPSEIARQTRIANQQMILALRGV